MFQRTGNLIFITFGKRNCYSGIKNLNPAKIISKKPIILNAGAKRRRVPPIELALSHFANRELNLDLIKPRNFHINNNKINTTDNKKLQPILDGKLQQIRIHFGESDCGEGGPDRPARGPCDPPEGPCVPMKKPGYPPKPRTAREPFCIKCPPKRPCNLNKCPTDSEGTCCRTALEEIAFILCSQSQRSCRLGGIHIRNYGTLKRLGVIVDSKRHGIVQTRFTQSGKSGCDQPPIDKPKCPSEKPVEKSCLPKKEPPPPCQPAKPIDPPVKVVYQKCPPVPELPKMPECVPPTPSVIIKCPPVPQCPKCPPETKALADKCGPKKPSPQSCPSKEKASKGFWAKLTGLMKKRKMSTSSESNDWKARKCRTVTEICSDKANKNNQTKQSPDCPKERRTTCYPEKIKCPELSNEPVVVEPEFIEEKIDYSKITCPPSKFGSVGSCPKVFKAPIETDDNARGESNFLLSMSLPKPPSEPVTLCPCPPPPKLHPGACPCAPEIVKTKSNLSTDSCPLKTKYACPKKRVFYCSSNSSSSNQRKESQN